MTDYDYIVIGGGSAGCVVANRLSADPDMRVLLLEAGPEPRSPWIGIPAGTSRLIFPGKYNWGYATAPEPNLHGREIYAPRGKTLGGSSAINGMFFLRGHREDFDGWRQMGNVGWGWDDVLPHFREIETFEGGASDTHGGTGELHVTQPRVKHPAARAFIAAAGNLGVPIREDLNQPDQDGVGFVHLSIRNGRRASSAEAFLKPVRNRRNLDVITDAHVTRIHLDDARRAHAVSFMRDGKVRTFKCRQEIVLCAGTLTSPRLLMLSGIGPGDHLAAMGTEVAVDAQGVGANLHDHLYVHSTWSVTPASSINRQLRGWRKYAHGAQYVLTRQGLLTMGASQACAFVRALPGATRPDVQVVFRPVSWSFGERGLVIGAEPEVGMSACQLRPHSRGSVTLSGPDPLAPPLIHANYLDSPVDQQAAVEGIRWMRQIASAPPLAERVRGAVAPAPAAEDDASILDYARRTAQSVHHWVGTCRMGNDEKAVVDARLRVRGVAGLRVADASVMPLITSANTNAASLMIGAKAASMIRDDRRNGALR